MICKNLYADGTNKIDNSGIKIKSIRYYGNNMKPQLNLDLQNYPLTKRLKREGLNDVPFENY